MKIEHTGPTLFTPGYRGSKTKVHIVDKTTKELVGAYIDELSKGGTGRHLGVKTKCGTQDFDEYGAVHSVPPNGTPLCKRCFKKSITFTPYTITAGGE